MTPIVDLALVELVRAEAAQAEASGAMTPALLSAIYERRLFRLWIPRSCGGDEVDLPASLDVFEATARADGSFGWTVTIGTGGGLFAAVLDPEAAREVFGPLDACIAGSGTPSGVAEIADGGYRARGRWRYASGAPHATCFTANCTIQRDGQPVLGPDGQPRIRAIAVPPRDVQIIPAWDTVGMRATASHDFGVADVFVPAARTFSVFDDEPFEKGPLYRFPFASIAELSFAAVALGIARHSLDAFAELASVKQSRGAGAPLAAQPPVRIRFANAEALVRSARAWFRAEAAEAWRTVEDGGTLTSAGMATVRLASVHATSACAAAVDELYAVAGMSPLFPNSEFGRCWRDLHTVAQHALLSPLTHEQTGAELLQG